MDPGEHTRRTGSRTAPERLAELRRRALDLILVVMLVAMFAPLALATPGAVRAGDVSFLATGWGVLGVTALLYALRALPFRVRAWAVLLVGVAPLVLQLPYGVAPLPLADAVLSVVLAALLLGTRVAVAWALFTVIVLAAQLVLPGDVLEALRVTGSPPALPPYLVVMGFFPVFGAIAGIATLIRGLVRSFEESQALVHTLEASEQRFRGIIEASPDAIALCAWPGAWIRDVNPGFTRVLGWTREEVLGHTGPELGMFRKQDTELLLARLRADGEIDQIEMLVRRRDGPFVSLQMSFRRAAIGGEQGIVIVGREVTAQRRLEMTVRHAQRVETMGTLAGGIAHNFRNALGSILPNLDFCMASAPPALRDALEDARSAASAAVDLAARLTRMAGQEAEARVGPIELRSVLADVVGICRGTFGARIAIHERLEAQGLVYGDRGDLHQIFLNLCLNARDALADATSPRIDLALSRSADGTRFVVTVSDNGHGMEAETLRRVGEPFFTTKPEGRGTGLGLSTAFAAVREMGGRIAVDSRPGAGTAFSVELPVHLGPARVAEAPAARSIRRDVRALVVDDDPLLLEAVTRQLGSLGLQAEPFTDPAAALARLRGAHPPFDLLVTDLDMPGLDGRELAARARELEPRLPIVILSATPGQEPLAGATAAVAKPASTADLASAVARSLGLEPASAA